MPASQKSDDEAVPGSGNSKTPKVKVTFSEQNIEHLLASEPPLSHSESHTLSISKSPSSSPSTECQPILKPLRRTRSMESHENPFTEEGELHKKAETILRHSTISRTEVRITDPDTSAEPEQIELMEAKSSSPTHAAPPSSDANGVNEQTVLKENGKPDQVDGKATKPKDKQKGKCKCCTIQ